MDSTDQIIEILSRYHHDIELSEDELIIMQDWLSVSEDNQQLFEDLSNPGAWERQCPQEIPYNVEKTKVQIRKRLIEIDNKEEIFFTWNPILRVLLKIRNSVKRKKKLLFKKDGKNL
jgi:hypothetical protein